MAESNEDSQSSQLDEAELQKIARRRSQARKHTHTHTHTHKKKKKTNFVGHEEVQ